MDKVILVRDNIRHTIILDGSHKSNSKYERLLKDGCKELKRGAFTAPAADTVDIDAIVAARVAEKMADVDAIVAAKVAEVLAAKAGEDLAGVEVIETDELNDDDLFGSVETETVAETTSTRRRRSAQ
jgi:hypothetical protein